MNFTQQYGKNRQRCQQKKFYYSVWQLLLYYYREIPSKILSVYKSLDVIPTLRFRSIKRGERIRIQLSIGGHVEGLAITLSHGLPDRRYVYVLRV